MERVQMSPEIDLNLNDLLQDLDIFQNWNLDDSNDLHACRQSWREKPIDHWKTKEVLEFISDKISPNCIGYDHIVTLDRFQCISGYMFQHLSEDSCKRLSNSDRLGEIIYNAKEKYIRCHHGGNFKEKHFFSHSCKNANSNGSDSQCDLKASSCLSNDSETQENEVRKRKGRPRTKTTLSGKLGKRTEKVWEFLIHLLRDGRTCPELIKWENFQEGTFKFVQSDKVARLWGSRKKNEKMNYEKFSRAMRYYYKSKVLLPVPGKRLVYKFGPQATGWQAVNPQM